MGECHPSLAIPTAHTPLLLLSTHPPNPTPVWAYQSKTTVKAAQQETEDGTVKRSMGVARGQALAVNGPECWKEDCDQPVAQVGWVLGGQAALSACMHVLPPHQSAHPTHPCHALQHALPPFNTLPAPALPTHLPPAGANQRDPGRRGDGPQGHR